MTGTQRDTLILASALGDEPVKILGWRGPAPDIVGRIAAGDAGADG